MKNIKHLLDVVDKVRDHVALGLMSDPGLSKTSQVKQWAEENGRRYCELIISQRMPSEISGMPMPVQDTKKMEVFDFETLLELEDGDVLAFDEFTNGNIQTLNACLTLIQERTMLSGKRLPSLVIVAMGNPQGKCDLLPQTKQRFMWVTVSWDEESWVEYIEKTWNMTPSKSVLKEISAQYRNGFSNPDTYNYFTPRTAENYLRIASKIKEDDPFWSVVDGLNSNVLTGIYASFKKHKPFEKIKKSMTDYLHNEMADPHNLFQYGALIVDVERCASMADIKELVMRVDLNAEAPGLISFLTKASENDE